MSYHWFTRKCDGMCDICDCPWDENASAIRRGRPYDGIVVDSATGELTTKLAPTEEGKTDEAK